MTELSNRGKTYQAARVVTGHCPECREVVVLFNEHEVWPPVECKCGWIGSTNSIDHYVRLEKKGVLKVGRP